MNHELSFDDFHSKKDRLYQVWENATFSRQVNFFNSIPFPSKEELKNTSTLIQNATITDWGSIHLLDAGDNKVNTRGYLAGAEFLQMFVFPLVEGNLATALQNPNSIVLTEKTAKGLFEKEKALGKVIRVDNKYDVTVTGIMKDVANNSSLTFEYLIPVKLFEKEDWVQEGIDDWEDNSWQVYVELKEGVTSQDADAAIRDMLTKHGQTDVLRELFLHPMEQWRLYTQFENGKASGVMIDYVRGFTKEQVLVVRVGKSTYSTGEQNYPIFKNKLSQLSFVKGVSASNGIPGKSGWRDQVAFAEGKSPEESVSTEYLAVDHNYPSLLDLEIIAGRNFSNTVTDREDGLLINEATALAMG